MNFREFIVYLGYFLIIINTLVFIISYNNKNKALKYFVLYLILCLFIQLISNTLKSLGEHNLFLTHYFFIGQFIFLSLFFSTLHGFKKIKNFNRLLTFIVSLSFVLYLNNNIEAYEKWNIYEIAITSITLLIYSFFFFIKKIANTKDKKYIYFNSGFFIYTLCSTLFFIIGNINSELKIYVWNFNALLYLIFQILIFVEWYKNFRKPLPLASNSSY